MTEQPAAPKLVFPTPKPHEPRRKSHTKTYVISALVVVALLVTTLIYRWFIFSITHISTNDSFIESDIWPVNSRNVGFIKEISVKEDQEVKKGDLLIELDDSDLQIELKYKKSRYDKGQADLTRAREMAKTRMMSHSDLETAEAAAVALEADLDGTLLKMDFTKVKAPTDGVVAKIDVHPGQFIQPGQTLAMVVDPSKIWVTANFKETQLEKVKVGMPVEVVIDAYPDVLWNGTLENIYPTSGADLSLFPPENATGNFTKIVQRIPTRVKIENKKEFELRPGMSSTATIVLK